MKGQSKAPDTEKSGLINFFSFEEVIKMGFILNSFPSN